MHIFIVCQKVVVCAVFVVAEVSMSFIRLLKFCGIGLLLQAYSKKLIG